MRCVLALALLATAGAFAPVRHTALPKTRAAPRSSRSTAMMAAGEMVPDMNKRVTMNAILLLGGVGPVVTALGVPFVLFFIPKSSGGGGGSIAALDRNGDAVTVDGWLKEHGANSKALVQGLKGDATYLLTDADKKIADFGINAVCTHLGCTVPWNAAENKFMCPCHGSQYNNQGKVVRGPAPLSLALAHVEATSGEVKLQPVDGDGLPHRRGAVVEAVSARAES